MKSDETRPDLLSQGNATRRDFLGTVLAASGLMAAGMAMPSAAEAACDPAGQDLEMYVVGSNGGRLRLNLLMTNEKRQIPSATTCGNPSDFRCFKVIDDTGKVLYPATTGIPRPGPILSAELGETVEITFLNHVDENIFGGSVDFGDPKMVSHGTDPLTGKMKMVPEHPQWGCDVAQNSSGKTVPFADSYPDCFHGSSAANLHFHGTHVTPNGFGDNVLVQVEPDPKVTLQQAAVAFKPIFDKVRAGQYTHGPVDWNAAIPPEWKRLQDQRLNNYDNTHQFQGKKLKDWGLSLKKSNDEALAQHEWPPYQMGAFPNAFVITKYDKDNPAGPVMGQAPGTHWYHAHKHGSTTLHLLHGLAGVFLIRGAYDRELQAFYKNSGPLKEKVLLLQTYATSPNLFGGLGGGAIAVQSLLVNGQLQPQIKIGVGEIQLWRIVNGAMQAPITLSFPTASVEVRQIAQDGVQFRFGTYQAQPLRTSSEGSAQFLLSPGNRIDLLVQGKAAGTVTSGNKQVINVVPEGTATMHFPVESDYPLIKLPFLDNIDPALVRYSRRVTFGWEAGRTGSGGSSGTPSNPPAFTINGKQFEEGTIDESMTLGSTEEWTLENATSVVHPFHIHVNPFQVFEVMDPNSKDASGNRVIPASAYPMFQNPTEQNRAEREALIAKCTVRPAGDLVWWDTLGIPAGLQAGGKGALILTTPGGGALGVSALPGYFKMRSRFVDFTGKFVLHCHILGHEDRGMMQLIEVTDRATTVKHH